MSGSIVAGPGMRQAKGKLRMRRVCMRAMCQMSAYGLETPCLGEVLWSPTAGPVSMFSLVQQAVAVGDCLCL